MDLLRVLFCLNLSLILLHEMDAIRCKEWKLFIYLKEMKENNGYKVFTLIHLPLYFFILFAILDNTNYLYLKISIGLDILFILHSIIHFLFRKNRNNEFNNLFSQFIIYGIGIISLIHMVAFFQV